MHSRKILSADGGGKGGTCISAVASFLSLDFSINKEVLPLKANLIVQEARFQVAQNDLNSAQAQLDAKQKELDVVQATYNAAMKKKQVLNEYHGDLGSAATKT